MKTIDEINALLIKESKEQRIKYSTTKAAYSNEYGICDFFASDIMGVICSESASVEHNLKNVFATANNNMVAGLSNEYRALSLEKKLEEEKKLKQTVFLFILKYGLMNEFRSFVSKYQGDVKEDIRCERMKHA